MSDGQASSNEKQGSLQAGGLGKWLCRLGFGIILIVITVNLLLVMRQLSTIAENSREHAFWELCHPGASPRRRADLFLKLIAEGNTEWRSAALEGLTLDSVNLDRAGLESVTLRSGSMKGATFTSATLNGASFDMCDLSNAIFANAKLRSASFIKSVLHKAEFRNADLLSASFEQAKVENADFVMAKMGDVFAPMADFSGSDFTGADLTGANLEAAILKDTNLALANFFGTNLTDADLTDSNWWRSRGLTTQQLEEFSTTFPPSANASESRQRDFKIWQTRSTNDGGEQ